MSQNESRQAEVTIDQLARDSTMQLGLELRAGEQGMFRAIRVPTMVLRSGRSDLHHTRKTSEDVHALIPGATIAEPPWPDNEWNMRGEARAKGEGLFQNWPKLAPQILDFAKRA